ncbi:unnamed protein product [Lactuca virosa]|uniref:Uncharacterized protein n=1 Tax=Lactuca virosa TaxID=75947 RepID=A0AAU9MEP5_9ASTR|nr:unnamed protein product [Lactuca virosa]
MFTGKPPWNSKMENNNEESPSIPSSISREGRSFLKSCFSRKACFRWTAEMLLAHTFLEGVGDDDDEEDVKVEELGDVLDINGICSSIMSDDEMSMLSFSDGLSYYSEDELHYWSEEDVSCFSVEENGTTVLNEVHQYPITFSISSGV